MSEQGILKRWRSKLVVRKSLEAAARARHKASPTPKSRALLELRKKQVSEAQRVILRHEEGVDPVALRYVVPHLTQKQAEKIAGGLTEAFKSFAINTPLRAAAAVAQMAHESDGFRVSEEYASGQAYEGRKDLGNTQPGDGKRFKGRGRIMVTGRGNYAAVSKAMGVDFVRHPERLGVSPWSEVSSAWWWSSHGCNQLADGGYKKFTALTRRINGGTTGLADRLRYYRRARKVASRLDPA